MDLGLHIFVQLSKDVYEERDKVVYKAEVTLNRSGAKLSSTAVLIIVFYEMEMVVQLVKKTPYSVGAV
jgi:hypothetical protein